MKPNNDGALAVFPWVCLSLMALIFAVLLFAVAIEGNTEYVDEVVQEALTSDDPFRRHAAQTLAGQHGVQGQWKLNIYRHALARGVRVQGLAKRTLYCPFCAGTHCKDGSAVRLGVCAANPEVPMGAHVWLEGSGLYKVCDRGGKVTLAYTRSTESANFDLWVPRCPGPVKWTRHRRCWGGPGCIRTVPYAIVSVPQK